MMMMMMMMMMMIMMMIRGICRVIFIPGIKKLDSVNF
jgi:hypothetical protein